MQALSHERRCPGFTAGRQLDEASLSYFRQIWIALAYGLLIGATVHAYVSPRRVVALLGRGGPIRRQVAGGLAGAPLMLCSCCITPVFQSVYESGARLGPALAVMLASPGLNPAALLLTFLLFPVSLGLAREAAARLAQALGYVSLRTIPLVVVGVLLSNAILPFSVRLSTGGTLLVVALVAAVALLLVLPTFFEIPLALGVWLLAVLAGLSVSATV